MRHSAFIQRAFIVLIVFAAISVGDGNAQPQQQQQQQRQQRQTWEARPNVTVNTGTRICPQNANGIQVQECGLNEVWCTQRSYGTQGAVSGACAPCTTHRSGSVSRAATPDQGNLCNCPVGYYCRQITNFNDAGTCVPYIKLGWPCYSDDDCVSATGHAYGSLALDDQSTKEGLLFCYEGTCSECNPNVWASGHPSFPGLSAIEQPYTCPGISMPLSQLYGFDYYLSNRPGETRTCFRNGTLVSGGAIDYSLVSEPLQSDSAATTSSSSSSETTTTDTSSSTSLNFASALLLLLLIFATIVAVV